MVGKGNQNVFLIHEEASNFAELEISEFEILRFDCISTTVEKSRFKELLANTVTDLLNPNNNYTQIVGFYGCNSHIAAKNE